MARPQQELWKHFYILQQHIFFRTDKNESWDFERDNKVQKNLIKGK